MNLRKTTRLGAALVVPALLFTAACGSDDGSDSGKGSGATVSQVSGKFGQQPKISAPKDAKAPDEVAVKTLVEGKGDKIAKGDQVRLDIAGQAMKDKRDLGSTWATAKKGDKGPHQQLIEKIGQPSQSLPPKVQEALVGAKPGSRLLVEGTAGAIVGKALNPQAGIKKTDGLTWVLDVQGAAKVDSKAEAEGKNAAVKAGLPKVESPAQKPAKITIPKGEDAPEKLEQQTLIKGDGKTVKAGDGVIAQYTGVAWEDGKKFDSSWDNGGATPFQIGTGAVVKGWDKALVGKKVGDRVLMVVPPKDAYGTDKKAHKLGGKTLVFVVDVVGTV
ncbi:FKBP-type peptidyl-prolyl cis-trans isomerase [Streptomyces coryli]|uniref:FKBP-type peptidyl-prolyl cis-trans isomerase n=1 Tax=Streptomyces coryli TaxID=1128680 RepID=UPI0019D20075|nr:FKBP-type peptidyl-prolyl cis-trans isomerase [Streptomyces coryli]